MKIKHLVAIGILLAFGLIVTAPFAEAQTLIGGSQINRVWSQNASGLGLKILGTASNTAIQSSGGLVIRSAPGLTTLFVNSSTRKVGVGTASPTVELEVVGTASGLVIHAQDGLSSSGALVWEGAASGASLWVSSFDGAGMADCDAAGQTLNWDDTTNRFTCGTDDGGISFTDMSSYFVDDAGDTMTGKLIINLTAGFDAIEVMQQLSGAVIHAQDGLSSSGALVWEGNASGAVLWVSTLDGAGLTDCDAATQTLAWDDTLNRFACGTDSDTTYVEGKSITLTANVFSLSEIFSGSHLRLVTAFSNSGTFVNDGVGKFKGDLTINSDATAADTVLSFSTETLKFLNATGRFEASDDFAATGNLTASGTFTVAGAAILQSTLRINGVTYTFPFSDGSASGKVLSTDGAGNLSWSADDTGAGGGMSFAEASSYYINDTGDTMTGALVIQVTGGATTTVGLEVKNTISGAIIHANAGITSSGTLKVNSGITMNIDATATNVGAIFGSDGTNESLYWLNAEDRFEFSDDLNVTGGLYASGGLIISGTATFKNGVNIIGGTSGQVLYNKGTNVEAWGPQKYCERFILFGPSVQAVTGSGMVFPAQFSGAIISANLQASGYGSGVAVQVRNSGAAVFTTTLSTDNKENNSRFAATPVVISTTASRFNKFSPLRIDVISVGTPITSTGVVMTLCSEVTSW